jgi:hypothetical protein
MVSLPTSGHFAGDMTINAVPACFWAVIGSP